MPLFDESSRSETLQPAGVIIEFEFFMHFFLSDFWLNADIRENDDRDGLTRPSGVLISFGRIYKPGNQDPQRVASRERHLTPRRRRRRPRPRSRRLGGDGLLRSSTSHPSTLVNQRPLFRVLCLFHIARCSSSPRILLEVATVLKRS